MVNVSDNKVTNDGCIKLMSVLRDCETLEDLNLSNNDIETAGAKSIS